MVAFEILRGAAFDLTRRTTQQLALGLIRSGWVAYVHLGTPCTVWSVARRGITNWVKARKKEEVSVALTLFSVACFQRVLTMWCADFLRKSDFIEDVAVLPSATVTRSSVVQVC